MSLKVPSSDKWHTSKRTIPSNISKPDISFIPGVRISDCATSQAMHACTKDGRERKCAHSLQSHNHTVLESISMRHFINAASVKARWWHGMLRMK
eukprot:scaffold421424_cov55-Prasinocladus_malaysianus.AAC.1